MALVVFLRGVNVGGHRTFRPSVLAADLCRFDVAGQPSRPDIVRFVSVLAKRREPASSIPFSLPSAGGWSLKVLACQGRFVVGLYRRDMKAIRYLGQVEKIFGVQATTRNWNTILAIARILKGDQ